MEEQKTKMLGTNNLCDNIKTDKSLDFDEIVIINNIDSKTYSEEEVKKILEDKEILINKVCLLKKELEEEKKNFKIANKDTIDEFTKIIEQKERAIDKLEASIFDMNVIVGEIEEYKQIIQKQKIKSEAKTFIMKLLRGLIKSLKSTIDVKTIQNNKAEETIKMLEEKLKAVKTWQTEKSKELMKNAVQIATLDNDLARSNEANVSLKKKYADLITKHDTLLNIMDDYIDNNEDTLYKYEERLVEKDEVIKEKNDVLKRALDDAHKTFKENEQLIVNNSSLQGEVDFLNRKLHLAEIREVAKTFNERLIKRELEHQLLNLEEVHNNELIIMEHEIFAMKDEVNSQSNRIAKLEVDNLVLEVDKATLDEKNNKQSRVILLERLENQHKQNIIDSQARIIDKLTKIRTIFMDKEMLHSEIINVARANNLV